MANKTAMKELIYWLECGWKDEDVDTVIKKANELLKAEKEQIKNAYKDCHDLGHIYGLDTEQYYNETYANDTTTGLPEEDSKRRAWHY